MDVHFSAFYRQFYVIGNIDFFKEYFRRVGFFWQYLLHLIGVIFNEKHLNILRFTKASIIKKHHVSSEITMPISCTSHFHVMGTGDTDAICYRWKMNDNFRKTSRESSEKKKQTCLLLPQILDAAGKLLELVTCKPMKRKLMRKTNLNQLQFIVKKEQEINFRENANYKCSSWWFGNGVAKIAVAWHNASTNPPLFQEWRSSWQMKKIESGKSAKRQRWG